jgi:hypothetical protein
VISGTVTALICENDLAVDLGGHFSRGFSRLGTARLTAYI